MRIATTFEIPSLRDDLLEIVVFVAERCPNITTIRAPWFVAPYVQVISLIMVVRKIAETNQKIRNFRWTSDQTLGDMPIKMVGGMPIKMVGDMPIKMVGEIADNMIIEYVKRFKKVKPDYDGRDLGHVFRKSEDVGHLLQTFSDLKIKLEFRGNPVNCKFKNKVTHLEQVHGEMLEALPSVTDYCTNIVTTSSSDHVDIFKRNLRKFPNLTILTVQMMHIIMGSNDGQVKLKELIDDVKSVPNLRSVHLHFSWVSENWTDDEFKSLEQLINKPNLVSIWIEGVVDSNRVVQMVMNSPKVFEELVVFPDLSMNEDGNNVLKFHGDIPLT